MPLRHSGPKTTDLLVTRDGAVVRATFNRPQVHNALALSTYDELYALCAQLRAEAGDEPSGDNTPRVLVLRGAGGKAFVSGTDIGEFVHLTESAAPDQGGVDYETRIERTLAILESLPFPTVAVIEGYAVGAGFALAAACDLRVCTSDAKFGVPIARTLGNTLSTSVLARCVALLGEARTREMLLLARLVDAAEARNAGLVCAVTEPEQLDGVLAEIVASLLSHAPLTLAATKEGLARIRAALRLAGAGVPDGDDLLRRVYGSADFNEGVRAFLAKRPPTWQGR